MANSLPIGFLNICSLPNKVREVTSLISRRGAYIFGLAETWLNDNISNGELAIPYFNLHRKDRTGSRGGGVAIYCHESLNVRRRIDLEVDSLELMWIEVKSGSAKHLIGCCYRPPDEHAQYWNRLESNLVLASEQNLESMSLIGDFNVDMLVNHTPEYKHLYSLCSTFGLTNFVQTPTRVTAQSSTLLDLFLSSATIEGHSEVLTVDISDHFAILTRLAVAQSTPEKCTRFASRQYSKVNWELFNQDLAAQLHSTSPLPNSSINQLTSSFISSIRAVLDRHAPVVVSRHKQRRSSPWTTTELVNLVRRRNHLFRQLTRDRGNKELEDQHRKARAAARHLDRRLKNQYFVRECSTTDQRKLWAVMNLVTGRNRVRTKPKASIQHLSEAFGDVVTDHLRPSHLDLPAGPAPHNGLSTFDSVSVDDITGLLRAVDTTKATGSDSIPGIVLRNCADVLAPLLTRISNASLSAGDVPDTFKVSYVSPLLKGGDASSPSNYRPISLLPIASRLMETAVKAQLTSYLQMINA